MTTEKLCIFVIVGLVAGGILAETSLFLSAILLPWAIVTQLLN